MFAKRSQVDVRDTIELGAMSTIKVDLKSFRNNSGARTAGYGFSSDLPPFSLEGEIRLNGWRLGVSSAGTALAVLLALRLFLPLPVRPLPSLTLFMLTSVGTAVFYFGVRLVTYWVVWHRISGNYPQKGGRYLGANGELPRNAFLPVFVVPIASFLSLCLVLIDGSGPLGPGWWVAIAVVAGLAFRDLKAIRHALFLDPTLWLKETPRGLNVLKLTVDHT
ncbi:MAG: hypothetical protein WBG50_17260 [Desulfomonilaceae bacterium]